MKESKWRYKMVDYLLFVDVVRKDLINNNFFEDMELLNEIIFVHLSEIILQKTCMNNANKYGLNTDSKDVLKQVYPFIYENRLSIMYPISEQIKIDLYNNLNVELSRDAIGKLYEECLSTDKRKDIGQFYTRSSKVIEYMLDTSNYTGEHVINRRIIDPAVGSGLFLVNAAIRLKEYMKNNGYSPSETLKQITDNYFAVDIDPFACYLTELNILLETIDLAIQAYMINSNFQMDKIKTFVGDFTIVPEASIPLVNEKNSLLEESKELNDIKTKKGQFKGGFSLVLSNPPYVTMYGSVLFAATCIWGMKLLKIVRNALHLRRSLLSYVLCTINKEAVGALQYLILH